MLSVLIVGLRAWLLKSGFLLLVLLLLKFCLVWVISVLVSANVSNSIGLYRDLMEFWDYRFNWCWLYCFVRPCILVLCMIGDWMDVILYFYILLICVCVLGIVFDAWQSRFCSRLWEFFLVLSVIVVNPFFSVATENNYFFVCITCILVLDLFKMFIVRLESERKWEPRVSVLWINLMFLFPL